jgi:hypothetical protein
MACSINDKQNNDTRSNEQELRCPNTPPIMADATNTTPPKSDVSAVGSKRIVGRHRRDELSLEEIYCGLQYKAVLGDIISLRK